MFDDSQQGPKKEQNIHQLLTSAEVEKFKALQPYLNWELANEISWSEVVRDPSVQPFPTTENERNYFANQGNVRAEILRLLFDIGNRRITDLEEFKERFAYLHRVLVMGYNGETVYVKQGNPYSQVEIERSKTVAGVFAPFSPSELERLNSILDTTLNMCRLFMHPFFQSDSSLEEKVKLICDWYCICAGYMAFFYANNSLYMNIVNTMLRLIGLKGISNGNFDFFSKDKLVKQLLQEVRKTNSDVDFSAKKTDTEVIIEPQAAEVSTANGTRTNL